MPDFTVDLDSLQFVGAGLNRPECVLATAAGDLYAGDWRGNGGVSRTGPAGDRTFYEAKSANFQVRPNGIAMLADGSFLLAHLGETGGVYRLHRDGRLAPHLMAVDGVELPPTNFVMVDRAGRTWATISTRFRPRARAYRSDVADGFIVLQDDSGARVVADGIGYTNECAIDPTGDWLYVNETFARRLSRFRLAANGDLGPRETVTEFGAGSFPDGLAFDREGGIWISAVVGNRVIRVAADGRQTVVLEDCEADHVAWAEAAYQAGRLGRPHLDTTKSRVLRNISSLAFGGPDLRTCYLGCLLGDRIATFRSPIAGVEPVHWHVK